MRQIVLIFFLVLGLMACPSAQPKNVRFINFSSRDGMPEKTVYSFAQDDLGFIWIGTANGLYRYDGTRFRQYRSPADSADHQISNLLQALYYHPLKNALLLGSNNAMQWLDLTTYTFHAPDYANPEIKKMMRAEINNFLVDTRGKIWVGTIGNSLYRFDSLQATPTHFYNSIQQSAPDVSKSIWRVMETPDGRIWAVSSQHLISVDPATDETTTFSCDKKFWFTDGFYDPDRNVFWLSAGFDGLVQFDPVSTTFTGRKYAYIQNGNVYYHKITKILPRNKDQLWAVAGNLAYIDLPADELVLFSHGGSDYDSRPSNLTNLFSDHQHNLWFGSFNNGFAMHPWQNEQIQTVPAVNAKKENLECLQVAHIDSSSGFLVAGNPLKGIMYYNAADQSTSYISDPQASHATHSTSVHHTMWGEIYAGDLKSLYQVDLIHHKLVPLAISDQFGRPIHGNYNLQSDPDGHLFVSASWKGIYKVNPKASAAIFHSYSSIDPDIDSTSTVDYIFPCLADSDGHMWFAGSNGIYRMKRGSSEFEKLGQGKANNTQSSLTKVFGITQDLHGRIWIATVSSGIFELDLNAHPGTLMNYTKFNTALPSDYCTDIATDAQGNLWIGTSDGIVRFDPVTKTVKSVLGKQHGLTQDDAGYGISVFPNNTLLVKGFGHIDIAALGTYQRNAFAPPPVITSLYAGTQELNARPVTADTSIFLTYDKNYLVFEFASLNHTNSNQNTYAYRMEGVDTTWRILHSNAPVTYSGLNSGRYIFQIRSANNEGVWNEKTMQIRIRIHPPFWRSWWFLTALGAGIGSLIFGLYRYRLGQVRKEEKMKSAYSLHISELEMKALRAQMNPHFIFNCLNSIQKYILKNDTFAASKYLTKFSRLIRLILDQSNQNAVLLGSELEMLRLYIEMESLRFDDKFDYRVIVDPMIQVDSIEIPSMLIQPYVENAIWHGLLHKASRGELVIEVKERSGNQIAVQIEDNGIGRERAAELKSKQVLKKKSYGIKFTEDRISVINKLQHIEAEATIEDLFHTGGEAAGTRVTIVIPYTTISKPDLP